MTKLKVGWFFGGRSVEHDISVITALQAYENLDKDKYEVIPVYVSKQGQFYSDPRLLDIKNYKNIDQFLLSLTKVLPGTKNNQKGLVSTGMMPKVQKLDIAFPIFHGSFGEDGCIQGLFEIYQLPYVGLNVTSSALCMDKILQKSIYQTLGLDLAKYTWFLRNEWLDDSKKVLSKIQKELKFPVFVKPATVGSSIGISKATNEDELAFKIEIASTYSDKILIEESLEDCIEVNCSALGYGTEIEVSVCEQPVKSKELLSFADKYQTGGKGSKGSGMASLSRIIPAPINDKLTKRIQQITEQVFRTIDGCGVIRIDFFVDPQKEKIYINEINSPPGSLAFYLWEKSGLSYKMLLDKLIELGLKRYESQKKTQFTFESSVLSTVSLGGAKK